MEGKNRISVAKSDFCYISKGSSCPSWGAIMFYNRCSVLLLWIKGFGLTLILLSCPSPPKWSEVPWCPFLLCQGPKRIKRWALQLTVLGINPCKLIDSCQWRILKFEEFGRGPFWSLMIYIYDSNWGAGWSDQQDLLPTRYATMGTCKLWVGTSKVNVYWIQLLQYKASCHQHLLPALFIKGSCS